MLIQDLIVPVVWGILDLAVLEGTEVLGLAVMVAITVHILVKVVDLALAVLVLMQTDLGSLVVLGLVVLVDGGSPLNQIVQVLLVTLAHDNQADLGTLVAITLAEVVAVSLISLAALEISSTDDNQNTWKRGF